MVKKISIIQFQIEKKSSDYLWKLSTISEQIFWKITVPYDFQPKFLVQDFFALENGYSMLFSWDQNLDGGGAGVGRDTYIYLI